MIRFDAYSATTVAANPYQLIDLFGDGLTQRDGRGFHTFGKRVSLLDDSGSEVGSVQWGGGQGERSMIEVKGERSPAVVEALRALAPHRVTRGDACADWDAQGQFERIYAQCLEVKAAHRLKGESRGDWIDFPEQGRSYYLGSFKSPVMTRLYDKGRQPEYRHLGKPNWCRLECQVRPAKEAKSAFSSLSAAQFWGASKWTRDLAARVLMNHVDPHPAGTIYKRTSVEQRLQFVCQQYGATFLELLEELGTWQCVGLTIGEKIKENQLRARGGDISAQ